MTENSSDTEKLKHTRVDFIEAGNQGSRHRREPSFSRWCDEEGRIQVDTPLKNADSSVQDIDFELPLLQLGRFVNRQFEEERNGYLKFQQTIMQSSDGETQVQFPIHIEGNESEKFEPLDIEKNSGRDNNGDNCESFQSGKYNSLQPDAKNPLSTAIVLKILFFIIVWYTFSLFLTLYNKSLLGDHLGRFPALLLMNTVHFTMQAVSSNFITWFWSARFQPHVTMTWRDYFMKDGLCLSQLSQLLLEQLWTLI